MSIATKTIDSTVLSWKALIGFVILSVVLIAAESIIGSGIRSQTIVARDLICSPTTISDTGEVTIQCGKSQDSFTDTRLAIALMRKPQPLVCLLHQAHGQAECSLLAERK